MIAQNMKNNIKLVHHLLDDAAALWPDRTAIETKNQSVTFSELQNRSIFYTSVLSNLGVFAGDRVVIEAHNNIDTVALMFATLAIGAAFCPLHTSAPALQRDYVMVNSKAVASIYQDHDTLVAKTETGTVHLPHFVRIKPQHARHQCLADFSVNTISEDIACLIYTSGSTGQPKGITCLHHQVIFAVNAISEVLNYQPSDKVFVAQPLSFDYGLYQIFLCFEAGATLHLADPRTASLSLLKELSKTRATILPAVPPMLDNLALLGKRKPEALKHLRLITNTGAAASQASVDRLRSCLPNLKFQLMYGLTECKRATINPPDADIDRPSSCGLPLRGTRITIIDNDGHTVDPGIIGEIVVQGPHLMAGYWDDDIQNAKRYFVRNSTIKELRTGDYGWLDKDGYLYCQGRRDDIFKQRGYRISCSEIETAACMIKGVKSAVLVPPKNKYPSVLFITFDDQEIDVIEELKKRLEEFKLPSKCISLPDIPTNSNGKFDRKQLEQLIHV